MIWEKGGKSEDTPRSKQILTLTLNRKLSLSYFSKCVINNLKSFQCYEICLNLLIYQLLENAFHKSKNSQPDNKCIFYLIRKQFNLKVHSPAHSGVSNLKILNYSLNWGQWQMWRWVSRVIYLALFQQQGPGEPQWGF